ncbi:16S rRNA (uracil(1498)-N(3))-methyltransferase [hydrothermal vent metagenome]|uniref:16S rRNA (uracil(1498)-N(3))-methyltransferase n=1 Tax=hydrothermal vent metagenome TaxID=652676 RepID=A0A3B0UVV8_9ZZZZ
MHRFFISPKNINKEQVSFPIEIAHQIRNVLRLSVDTAVIVLDNSGWEYEVNLRQVDRQHVVGQAVAKRPSPNEPTAHLTLYQSLMKRDKFEWVLQKGTEIGVSHFVPLVTQRSLIQKVDIKDGKLARWEKIITEAAEQSRRGRIPTLQTPVTLGQALAKHPSQPGLIAWEETKDVTLREVLSAGKRPSTISLFIGPEGGFAAEEIGAAQTVGLTPITLGKRILRAETAALVASALILYELDEI